VHGLRTVCGAVSVWCHQHGAKSEPLTPTHPVQLVVHVQNAMTARPPPIHFIHYLNRQFDDKVKLKNVFKLTTTEHSRAIDMNADDWRKMIVLQDGESLEHESHRTKGFMEETDIDTYAVLGPSGTKVGSVAVSDHTAVRGFRRTVQVTQKDATGNVVVEKSYTSI